jgi:GntR family transcriptional regulator, transcriptional repressor for pyruvate dehydrogenase complex
MPKRRTSSVARATSGPRGPGIAKSPAAAAKRATSTRKGASNGNAYRRVAENFRVRILTGHLRPGDRLPNEGDLALEEGVGRTTVREALRLLASSGLVETRRGVRGGAFVTHPTAEDLDNAMMTALSLMTMSGGLREEEVAEATQYTMPTIARIAATRATDEEVETLVSIAASLGNVRSDAEWVEIGSRFNLTLVEVARSRLLSMLIKPLMRVAPMHYKEQREEPGWREKTAAVYQDLADAIRRRAPSAAEDVMLRLRERYGPSIHLGPVETPKAARQKRSRNRRG